MNLETSASNIIEMPKTQKISDFLVSEYEVEGNLYPQEIFFENDSVESITEEQPGVFLIKAKKPKNKSELLGFSGGIHGDEKAGIEIADNILGKTISGSLEVQENFVVIYGNLRSFNAYGRKGYRVEPREKGKGALANLNRCFLPCENFNITPEKLREYLEQKNCTRAQKRAFQIMYGLQTIIKESKAEYIEFLDIHQSFNSPKISEVQQNRISLKFLKKFMNSFKSKTNEDFYTFMVAYVNHLGKKSLINWVRTFSGIISGAVIREISKEPSGTFAEYNARLLQELHVDFDLDGFSATLEMGEAGRTDSKTRVPQLQRFLEDKISGTFSSTKKRKQEKQNSIEIWEVVGEIHKTKASENFTFLDENGNPIDDKFIKDFVPFKAKIIASDGVIKYVLEDFSAVPLFANREVGAGDRIVVLCRKSPLSSTY